MKKVKSTDQQEKAQVVESTENLEKKDDLLLRALADYQNLVKRTEKEKTEILARANKNIIEEMVQVLALLKRAQDHLNDSGLEMAIAEYAKILQRNGLESIEPKVGDEFSAHLHEAIELADGGTKNTIANLLEVGYKWKDGLILKPAKVIVCKGETKNE